MNYQNQRQETLLLEQRDKSEEQYDALQQTNASLQISNMSLEQRISEATTLYEIGKTLSDTLDTAELLEREGRGYSEFRKKWKIAMSKWDTDVAEAAKIPKKERDATPPAKATIEMVQGEDGVWRPDYGVKLIFDATTPTGV